VVEICAFDVFNQSETPGVSKTIGSRTDQDTASVIVANTLPARSGAALCAPDFQTYLPVSGAAAAWPAEVSCTLNAHFGSKQGLEDQHALGGASLFVAHSLRAEGFDASEDGTGRGTPLVPVAYPIDTRNALRTTEKDAQNRQGVGVGDDGDPSATLTGLFVPAVAFSCKDNGRDAATGVAPTLRSMNSVNSNQSGGGQVAVAFHNRQDPDVSGPVTHPLGAQDNGMAVAFDTTQVTSRQNYSNPKPGDPCHPLASSAHPPAIAGAMQVRRLTPRECERLQGFPDDYTLIPFRNLKPTAVLKLAADGNRYKALGNSMAVNVMSWIGQRIEEVA